MNDLKEMASHLRMDVMKMVYHVKDGHPGPAFSIAEIITVLYFGGIMNVRPDEPKWKDRDRFILSKGHACTILYAALARRGFFPYEEIYSFRKIDSRLQGHPYLVKTPGNDATTGSLGNGMAMAVGMARGLKLQKSRARVYCIIGDGEMNEGIIWEAIMAAANMNLSNLTVFLDNNGWQSGGALEDTSGLKNLEQKVSAFGWETIKIDGHNMNEIRKSVKDSVRDETKPTMIICNTIKGKGLDFMENDNSWHKRVPDMEQMKMAEQHLTGVKS